jgi:rhodanese-related sulfurtransferase
MRKTHSLKVALVGLLFLLLSSCQLTSIPAVSTIPAKIGKEVIVDGGSFTNVSAPELQELLNNKDFTLINVHIPYEGNLPKTDLSIPYDTIGQNLSRLPGDKNAKLLLYCRSGRMSDIAARELVKRGYTNIWNLEGGMVAWEQAGLQIQK